MTKLELITRLKKEGKITNRQEFDAALEKWRSAGGIFDDDIQASPPPVNSRLESSQAVPVQKAPAYSAYKEHGTMGALLPATARQHDIGGGRVSRAIATAGDAFSLLPRGVSAAATGLGALAGGRDLSGAYGEAMKELEKTKSDESGALGVAQDIALDPTTWVPAGPIAKGGKALITAAKAGAKEGIKKAVPTVGKALLKTGISGAAEGAASGAYQQAAEGEVDAGRTALQAGLGFGMGAASAGLGKAVRKGTGELLKNSAIRNLDITLRPKQSGIKLGYDHDNAIKHDLIGSPREIMNKAKAKLDDLQKSAMRIGKDSQERFNVDDIFESAKRSIDPEKFPSDYKKQLALIDEVRQDYKEVFGDVVDAPTAMKIRSRIGDKSAFVGRVSAGTKVDPEADWKEDAFNKVYFKLKDKLHGKLGSELKAINKAQSEIIPVLKVAERRVPIAESNYRVGLTDLLTVGTGGTLGAIGGAVSGDDNNNTALKGLALGAALAGGRRAFGSPAATRLMYRMGNKLAPTVGAAIPSSAPARRVKAEAPAPESVNYDVPAFKRNPRIKNERVLADALNGPVEFSDDPLKASLMSKKDLLKRQKELKAAEELQALQGREIPDYNPDQLMSEKDLFLSKMDVNPPKSMGTNPNANSIKSSMRRYLGLGNREIKLENLPAKKQAQINKYAEDIINNPDMRERFIEAGLIGEMQESVHPDDIIRWLNEAKINVKKNAATMGDALKNINRRE